MFDDVFFFKEGVMVYYGFVDNVVIYFKGLGFVLFVVNFGVDFVDWLIFLFVLFTETLLRVGT